METIVVPAATLKAFTDAVEAARVIAAQLSKIDRAKLDDSETKFLLIRAIRMEHLGREVKGRKSLRQ